jgi:hypothetical protein
VSLGFIAGIAIAGMPHTTSAAARKITLSTYQSNVKCRHDAGEDSYVLKNDGSYTLLQVSGKTFMPNGPAYIYIVDSATWTVLTSGTALAGASGRVQFRTDDVEVCKVGVPRVAQAYDIVARAEVVAGIVGRCTA